MKSLVKIVGALALVVGSGLTTAAVADVSTMTCGEYANATTADQIKAGGAMLTWINDTANVVAAGALGQKYANVLTVGEKANLTDTDKKALDSNVWTADRMHVDITVHCYGMSADTTVVAALME